MENILADVTEVHLKTGDGEDRPDILLERKDKPPSWLLFTQPSPLSIQGLTYCMAHGIDAFELDGGNLGDPTTLGICQNRHPRGHA